MQLTALMLLAGIAVVSGCSMMPGPVIDYGLPSLFDDKLALAQFTVVGTISEEVDKCPGDKNWNGCPTPCPLICGKPKQDFCMGSCGEAACVCGQGLWLHKDGESCVNSKGVDASKGTGGLCSAPSPAPTTESPWGGGYGGGDSPAEMTMEVESYYCGCGPETITIKGCRFCAQPNSCDPGRPQPGQKWAAWACEWDDDEKLDNEITLAKFSRHEDSENEQFGSTNPYTQLGSYNEKKIVQELEGAIGQIGAKQGCKKRTPEECAAKKMDAMGRKCRMKRTGKEELIAVEEKIAENAETCKREPFPMPTACTAVAKAGWSNRLLAARWDHALQHFNAQYTIFDELSQEDQDALADTAYELKGYSTDFDTALEAAKKAYATASEQYLQYVKNPRMNGGATIVNTFDLLLNYKPWERPPGKPDGCGMPWSEPCEPVASNVVDFSKTYEATYLTKVLAELEKINPKPWEQVTSTSTTTVSVTTTTTSATATTTTTNTGTSVTTATVTSATVTTSTVTTFTVTTISTTTTTATTTSTTTTNTNTTTTTATATTITTITTTSTSATVTTIDIGADTTEGAETTTAAAVKTSAEIKLAALEQQLELQTLQLENCQASNATDDGCAVELQSVTSATEMVKAQSAVVKSEAKASKNTTPATAASGSNSNTAIVVAAIVVVVAVMLGAVVVIRARNNNAGGGAIPQAHSNPMYQPSQPSTGRSQAFNANAPYAAANTPQYEDAGYMDIPDNTPASGYADATPSNYADAANYSDEEV